MTQEQKDKMEQVAESSTEILYPRGDSVQRNMAHYRGFKAGAQTILDNPGEWGLLSSVGLDSERRLSLEAKQQLEWESAIQHEEIINLKSENQRLRDALEAITRVFGNPISSRIAKEALKQQDND